MGLIVVGVCHGIVGGSTRYGKKKPCRKNTMTTKIRRCAVNLSLLVSPLLI